MLGPKKILHSLGPVTRLDDRSQEEPRPDETCALKLLCTGDPFWGAGACLDLGFREAQGGRSLHRLAQGKETYEEWLGPGCLATDLLSILGAKGQNLDPQSE